MEIVAGRLLLRQGVTTAPRPTQQSLAILIVVPEALDDPVMRPFVDAIADKAAYEREFAEAVRRNLDLWAEENGGKWGRHTISVTGAFPDTRLVIHGPGLKYHRPHSWEFEIWGWTFEGDPPSQATMIAANMAD